MAHPQHAAPRITIEGEIRPVVRAPALERFSWALYDFANTIFSMNIASLYFTVWLVSDLVSTNTTSATANAIASIIVVLAIPYLGALSYARLRRKPCTTRPGTCSTSFGARAWRSTRCRWG